MLITKAWTSQMGSVVVLSSEGNILWGHKHIKSDISDRRVHNTWHYIHDDQEWMLKKHFVIAYLFCALYSIVLGGQNSYFWATNGDFKVFFNR